MCQVCADAMDASYFMQEMMAETSAVATNTGIFSIKIERIESVPDIQMDEDENVAAEALSQLGGGPTYPTKSSPAGAGDQPAGPSTPLSNASGRGRGCRFCSATFRSKAALSEHLASHGVRAHSCRVCGMPFQAQPELDKHMLEQHKAQLANQCKICGQQFSRASSLTNHQKIHTYTPGRAMAQNLIGDEEELEEILTGSIKTEASPKSSALTLPRYANGVKTEKGQLKDASTCRECGVGVEGHGPHLCKAPPRKVHKHACDECEKTFPTKQKLFRHSWTHRLKSYNCEQCGTQYHTQEELKAHRATSHQANSPYSCAMCAKTFGTRQGQWEHQRSHCGAGKRFFCQRCEKRFSSRQGFRIHMRSHTDDKPYGCQYCKQAFRDGGTLRKHERIHTGERPHACPICSKAFNQKVVLRDHVRTHSRAVRADADGLLACAVCPDKFQDQDELSAHLVRHSDELAQIAREAAKASRPPPPE